MATAVPTSEAKGMFGNQCAWPTLQSMEEAVRSARRRVNSARNATEDFVAGTTLEIRRHPITAVGLAATAGLIAGATVALAGAWFWKHRSV